MMFNVVHLKADLKQIVREPVLVLFMLIPLFVFIFLKFMIIFFIPLLFELTGFDLLNYREYFLSFILLMTPGMLGTVVGFLMIDDRDAKIYQLMSVMPLGSIGYMANRLVIPFVGAILYTFIGYYVLDLYKISFQILFLLTILLGIQGIIIGLMLFTLAEDKVQGLTYSKAFGLFYLLSLTDLLDMRWASVVAGFTPFYWVYKLIYAPRISSVLLSVLIHAFWFGVVVNISRNQQ